tara:strand:- start:704 stop:1936 length:1233 start_codon:yes stop_codon:yes gene_type:complete
MPPKTATEPSPKAKLFEYKAMRVDGTAVVGRATAVGELDLDRLLQRDGLMLVKATPSKAGRGLEAMRMKRQELVAFTNQLATMIQAGVPLLQSLQHLAEHSRSKAARDVVQSVLRQIEGGASLSEAFEAHPGIFPGTYVAMVKSGEMSTSLPDVLRRQGKYMEWVREVQGITKQAMIYPTALSFAIVGLVVILITFLIPALVGLFPGGHEDLPIQTKFVMAISDFVRNNWILLASIVVTAGASFVVMLHVPSTRMMLSRTLLKLPRLGSLMEMLAVARFATTASALQQSGCNIVRTLEIAGDSCGSTYMTAKFRKVLESVRGGESISDGMRAAGDLDPYLVQLTSVGETSGRLGECLDFIADSYNAEVPRVVKWALGLIEPLVLIIGGVIVAFLLLAALLPIFKIYETLG